MKMLNWTDPTSAEELLRRAEEEEIVVLHCGHPVALLTPLDDDELEWYLREREPAFVESIAAARASIAAGEGTSQEDLKRELGL